MVAKRVASTPIKQLVFLSLSQLASVPFATKLKTVLILASLFLCFPNTFSIYLVYHVSYGFQNILNLKSFRYIRIHLVVQFLNFSRKFFKKDSALKWLVP
jgi:hypothetical protein